MAERSEAAIIANQPRVAPALSATSDAPQVVETKAEPEADAKPGKDETVKAEKVETEKDTQADAKPEGDEPIADDTPPPIKREITKERNRRRDAESKAADTQARLDKALTALENVTGNKQPEAEKAAPRPKRADYADAELYDTALIQWAAETTAKTEQAKAATKAANDKKAAGEAEVKTRIEGMQKAWTKARDAFAAEHPDYEEIAESETLQISHAMAAALLESPEDGVKLAYWLGKNPDEAERLSKLSPQRAAIELGRISERLEVKPAREPKPKPITPLNGSRGDGQVNGREPSSDEWYAKRTAEIQASRRPFIPAGRPN